MKILIPGTSLLSLEKRERSRMAKFDIKKIYLYVATLIGLILLVVGGIRLVGLGLKAYVFTDADTYYRYPTIQEAPSEVGTSTVRKSPSEEKLEQYEKDQRRSQRHKNAAESLSFIIIGLPIYIYHWRKVQDNKS